MGLENTLGAVVTKRGLRRIEDILPNNGEIDKFNRHAPVTSMHAKFDVAIVQPGKEEASATDFKTEEDISIETDSKEEKDLAAEESETEELALPTDTNFQEAGLPVETNFQEEELPVETNFQKELPVETNFQEEELPVETNFQEGELPVETNFQKEDAEASLAEIEKDIQELKETMEQELAEIQEKIEETSDEIRTEAEKSLEEAQEELSNTIEEIENDLEEIGEELENDISEAVDEAKEELSIEDTMTEDMTREDAAGVSEFEVIVTNHVEKPGKHIKKTIAKNADMFPSGNTMMRGSSSIPNTYGGLHSKADGTYSCCVSTCEWFCLDIDGDCLEEEDAWYCVMEVDD